jgi:hypothetical protein
MLRRKVYSGIIESIGRDSFMVRTCEDDPSDEIFVEFYKKSVKVKDIKRIKEGQTVRIIFAKCKNGKMIKISIDKPEYWTEEELVAANKRAQDLIGWINECRKSGKSPLDVDFC